MSEQRTIRFYECDDFVWVFADSECIFAGHSIRGPELLEALKYEDFEVYYEKDGLPEDALWNVDDTDLASFDTDLFERTR